MAPGDGKVEFIANENDVVKVSKDGEVTILGPGTARVYAVATGTNNFNRDISDAIVITVEDKKSDPDIKNNVENTTTAMQNATTPDTTTVIQNTSTTNTKIAVPRVVVKKLKAGKKQIRLTWKKQSKVSGYEIRYATKANMKKAKQIKVNAKTASKAIKKLKSKKRYYIQIRAYKTNDHKKIYGNWSIKKTLKTK